MNDPATGTDSSAVESTAGAGRRWSAAFWVVFAAGLVVRLLLLGSSAFVLDSDTSIVYLMAVHVSQGELSAFFWGQGYGGTLIQTLGGAVMAITGPDPRVLAVVEVAIMAVAVVLLRVILLRGFGAAVATVAACLVWLPGYLLTRQTTLDPGFYVTSILLAMAAIAWAGGNQPRRWLYAGATGLLVGLAFWQSIMGAALALPALYLVFRRDRSRSTVVSAIAGIAIGMAPWIIGSVERSLLSTLRPGGNPIEGLFVNSVELVIELIPTAFTRGSVIDAPLGIGLTAAVIGGLVWAILTRHPTGIAIFGGAAVLTAALVASGAPLGDDSARYTAFFMPAIATALAWAASRIPWRHALTVAFVAALVHGSLSIALPARGLTLDAGPATTYGADAVAIGEYLEDEGVAAAYAGYWISYRIVAATDERVVVSDIPTRRYPPYLEQAEQGPTTIVAIIGGENDHALRSIPDASRTEVAGYAIYRFDEPVDVAELGLGIQ